MMQNSWCKVYTMVKNYLIIQFITREEITWVRQVVWDVFNLLEW